MGPIVVGEMSYASKVLRIKDEDESIESCTLADAPSYTNSATRWGPWK
jgi:hypothetical protein